MLLLLGLILPLGLDTFAVSTALGVARIAPERRLGLSLLFAGFEGGLPLIGLLLGVALGQAIGDIAGYVAIAGLIGVGGYVLLADEGGEESRVARLANAKGLVLLTAGVAVGLDELAIGFTFGLLDVPVVPALAAIALQAFVISQIGFQIGRRVEERVREGAERVAGIVLVGFGLVLLVSKVTSTAL